MSRDRSSLKDQLKDWKKAQPSPEPAPQKPAQPSKIITRGEGRPPPPKTDQELFDEAVRGVNRDALLSKFDQAPVPAVAPSSAPAASESDAELFLRHALAQEQGKGGIDARLSVKGSKTEIALRRVLAFVDEAARSKQRTLLIELDLHINHDAIDMALSAHAAVERVREVRNAFSVREGRIVHLR